MRFELNKFQRVALIVAASAIVIVQFAQFDDQGFRGYGWVFSFLVAGALIVVALAKNFLPDALENISVNNYSPPSNERLEIAHAALRENAEILVVEVEQRAITLARLLIDEKDKMAGDVIYTVQGSKELGDKFVEQFNIHIHDYCILLMLGLVGMRRSKGNKTYITGVEFKTLQDKVREMLINSSIASQAISPVPLEVNPDALSTAIFDRLQQVRKTITQYCISNEAGAREPESALLDWFSKSGFRAKGRPQVTHALYHENPNNLFQRPAK